MLPQKLVRLHMESARRGIPDDLVDAHDLGMVLAPVLVLSGVAETHEKHARAGYAGRIDRGAERDAQQGLQVESIERVDDRELRAVGRERVAIGERHRDAPPGELVRVANREAIARERTTVGSGNVERRFDAGRIRAGWRQREQGEQSQNASWNEPVAIHDHLIQTKSAEAAMRRGTSPTRRASDGPR